MNDTLKTLRQSKKITQTKASEYLGVSLRTYKTYENDQSKIGTMKYDYMLQKLAELNRIDETHGILSIDEIKSTCKKVFDDYPIHYCYLFGSYAKKRAKEDSDIDLLISSDVTGIKYYGMVEKLKDALHKEVDALGLEQLSENSELLNEILQDGVKIYG